MCCGSMNLVFSDSMRKVVWDDYIDVCMFSQHNRFPTRPVHRCEKSNDIFVEERLYRDDEPYLCLAINNTLGVYKQMIVQMNGGQEFRRVEFKLYRPLLRMMNNINDNIINVTIFGRGDDSFVIYPSSMKPLQRIISIQLDGLEMCDPERSNELEPVYESPPNQNLQRFFYKCMWIESRLYRPPTLCELQPELILEDLNYAGLVNFTCLIYTRRLGTNGNGTIDVELTMSSDEYFKVVVCFHKSIYIFL